LKRLIFALILIGCASTPKWYLSPPKDNQNYLFATGSGDSKKEAINQALNFAASKINTQISSTLSISQNLYSTNNKTLYNKTISQNITTKINNISLSDYKVIKEDKEDKYYVVIAINKIKNSILLTQRARDEINSITPYLKTTDKIEILKTYPKLIKKINKAINTLYSAKILYPYKDIDPLLKKAKKIKLTLIEKLNSITFTTKNPIIQNVLSSLNLPISNNGIKIDAKINFSNNKIGNYYITSATMHTTLKDKTTLSFDINCGGKSIIDFQNAKEFAIRDCEEKLKEKLKNILR
jgi:hypothetical protein